MSHDEENVHGEYQRLKNEFIRVKKRIIKKNLSKNPAKLAEYKSDIIAAHDAIIEYVAQIIRTLDDAEGTYFREELVYIRDKTIDCFGRLRLRIGVSKNLLQTIDENFLISDNSESELEAESELEIESGESEQSEAHDTDDFEKSFKFLFEEMAEFTATDFLRLAAQTINRNYAGDPLALNSFINSVRLLQQVQATHGDILRRFILTKLEGRALEAVPTDATTVDAIIDALKGAIKPDSSKVIEGRMLSLRMDRSKIQDFTKQAEELAEALERALIVEGISQAKAKSMTVDKTVEMCRNSTKSDTVKTILAAATFHEPKEVVAKLVVEGVNEVKDKQILAYRQQNRSGNNRNNRGKYNKYNKGWKNQSNNNGNNNGQKFNKRKKNYGNNYSGNYSGNANYQDRFVRVAENAQSPPRGWRVDQNQPQTSQQSLAMVPYQRD